MATGGGLPDGAYEALISARLQASLAGRPPEQVRTTELDPAEAADRIAAHVKEALHEVLDAVPKAQRPQAQAAFANGLLRWIAGQTDVLKRADNTTAHLLAEPAAVLRQLHPELLPGQRPPPLPDIPLVDHDLLANARGEPSLSHALGTELATADRIDAVVAFIRWAGLAQLRSHLSQALDHGVPVRVLTTVFTGSTERHALDWLVGRGAQVKVSYDTRTTRLHAKAWILHRDSGFSTAFVGSSNLSKSALVDGIEWNVRLAQAAAPAVLDKLTATFDSLWNDPGFEAYLPDRDGDRFEAAITATAKGTAATGVSGIEVRPWPYQQEILEALRVARRRHDRSNTLVVAPTGTGKTVVAALDYKALREGEGGIAELGPQRRDDGTRGPLPLPSLLFVAHREQILDQSLQTFRDVLAQGDFGEKLVGGHRPREWRHVFASIQSLHAMGVEKLDPEQFDVVIVDEFHHAEAETYKALLDRMQPTALVGLTATPERTDGTNVRDRYFDGRYAFEMRLWDALDGQLLAPFHYYGVADGTDLSGLTWQRGGYKTTDLEQVYVVDGHDARTAKVLAALREQVPDPTGMRAFGFCVSKAHAAHMARKFDAAGIPATSMTGDTPAEERQQMLTRLRDRELNVIFSVDVLTEGVDVPEVDTILLLRPTESATVFLQQLGRGLRRHAEKSVCTVLDFIGQQHRRFRADLRLRALTGRSRRQLSEDTQKGFPFLPPGCHLQLDRQSEAHILDNLKAVTSAGVNALAAELRSLESQHGRPLTLAEFLHEGMLELEDVYRSTKGGWTGLRRRAGTAEMPPVGPMEAELAKGIRLRLQEVDDVERLTVMLSLADEGWSPGDARERRLAAMVGAQLFGDGKAPPTVEEIVGVLQAEPAIRQELAELAEVLDEQASTLTRPSGLWPEVPLQVHATYGRSEVLLALGDRALGQPTAHREGVKYIDALNADVFFVTLEKSERDYSPTTMYRDYAISRELFHWESQSVTARDHETGRRYVSGESTVLLFVRQSGRKISGRTPGFTFMGPVTHVDDRGETPIQITWRLQHPMPAEMFAAARAAAG